MILIILIMQPAKQMLLKPGASQYANVNMTVRW